jgi:hypothetical protein
MILNDLPQAREIIPYSLPGQSLGFYSLVGELAGAINYLIRARMFGIGGEKA